MYFPLTNANIGVTLANEAFTINAILADVLFLRQQRY